MWNIWLKLPIKGKINNDIPEFRQDTRNFSAKVYMSIKFDEFLFIWGVTLKVAVIGSRGIEQLKLEQFLPEDICEIISGGARHLRRTTHVAMGFRSGFTRRIIISTAGKRPWSATGWLQTSAMSCLPSGMGCPPGQPIRSGMPANRENL